MTEQSAHRFDVAFAAGVLAELHEQVIRRQKRFELTRDGESCVLISKHELESLERALEILARTDTYRAMSRKIAQLATQSTQTFGAHQPN